MFALHNSRAVPDRGVFLQRLSRHLTAIAAIALAAVLAQPSWGRSPKVSTKVEPGVSVGVDPALKDLREPYVFSAEVLRSERQAKIFPGDGTQNPAPVLFYFHGYSTYAPHFPPMEYQSEKKPFHQLWPEAIIVYAQGTAVDASGEPIEENYYGWTLRFPYKYELGQTKDIAYIEAILAHLKQRYAVDEERVYAAGGSSGGFLTFSLMELMPDVFSAFAVIGSYARFKVVETAGISNCSAVPLPLVPQQDRAEQPRPVLYMFGEEDGAFDSDCPGPLDGWAPGVAPSRARATLRQLLIRNDCPVPPGQYWTLPEAVFAPLERSGARVHWVLYEGGHGAPDNYVDHLVDFFAEERWLDPLENLPHPHLQIEKKKELIPQKPAPRGKR